MEQLISFIIRPPRAEYCPETDLLDDEFMLKGKWYQRKDVEILNSRGDKLQCSHYIPLVPPEGKALPCVIYCHGNSGCRTDASEAAIILLPSNISVFALDFSGSGLSGGEHVTLGWNEKDDLKAVVEYLRADGNVSLIGLWGRSMGAVSSLMYGAEDPSIAGMVLDSPFSDLVDLMMELVDTYKVRFPKFTVKLAIQYMRRAIQKKAKFDIMDLNTIKVAKSCFVPVLIGHAVDDDFIHPHHSDRIYEAYMGEKNIIKFDGDHNSPRPQFYFDSINIFFHNVLQPPDVDLRGPYIDYMSGYMDKSSHSSMHELGYGFGPLTSSTELGTGSTEEAIRQLRSKRSMTRMEVPSDDSSKAKHSDGQEEGKSDYHNSSSSNMISFELSGGNPYVPHVPAIIDDDEYVEYPLDSLSGFPSNIEEEEKMLMEAIMMSLKDQEIGHPEAGEPHSTCDINSSESSERDHGAVSGTDKNGPIRNDFAAPATNDQSMASEDHASNTSLPSKAPLIDSTPIIVEPGNPRACVENGVSMTTSTESSSANSGSEADISSNTKATLTVERTPSGNIMDGLRRWDFNFFRNRR